MARPELQQALQEKGRGNDRLKKVITVLPPVRRGEQVAQEITSFASLAIGTIGILRVSLFLPAKRRRDQIHTDDYIDNNARQQAEKQQKRERRRQDTKRRDQEKEAAQKEKKAAQDELERTQRETREQVLAYMERLRKEQEKSSGS